jgi:hypothetical protein
MGKDLNDALQRLARWEELERRRSNTDSPLDEAVLAVKRVVERHPELALTLTVRGPAGTAIVQVDRHDDQVRVIVHRVTQPPEVVGAAPAVGATAPAGAASAADSRPAVRLAELLREDPYLLSGPPGD